MRSRRGLLVAVVLAAAGGGTAALSGTQTWGRATARTAVSAVPVAVSGGTAAPLGTAAGVVGLAAVGALLATRRTGRTLVGLLLVLAGAAALVPAARFLADPAAGRYTAVGVQGSTLPAAASAAPASVAVSAWPALTCAAAVLLLLAGLTAAVAGRSWPALGRRYEAPRAAAPPTARQPAGDGALTGAGTGGGAGAGPGGDRQAPRPAALWDDLDAGRDPTAAGPDDRGR